MKRFYFIFLPVVLVFLYSIPGVFCLSGGGGDSFLRGLTIGEGGDTTISSLGRSPKQPLPGMRLHDPLDGRQACPGFIAFDQGVGQTCPR